MLFHQTTTQTLPASSRFFPRSLGFHYVSLSWNVLTTLVEASPHFLEMPSKTSPEACYLVGPRSSPPGNQGQQSQLLATLFHLFSIQLIWVLCIILRQIYELCNISCLSGCRMVSKYYMYICICLCHKTIRQSKYLPQFLKDSVVSVSSLAPHG